MAITLGFVWVFIISVPLAVRDANKRKAVQQSYFYSTIASLLNGPLFLPIAFGLLLPFRCKSVKVSIFGNTTSQVTMNNTFKNSSAGTEIIHQYTCWENSEAH